MVGIFIYNVVQSSCFEHRACYLALPIYICGFVVLGATFQRHLGTGALIMGWGIAELAIMINTVAVYAYLNDCFPKHQVGPFFFPPPAQGWCSSRFAG